MASSGDSGLELFYDEVLAGSPGSVLFERATNGNRIPSGKTQVRPAVAGDDLRITLDRRLQFLAEDALAEQVLATRSGGGMLIALDVESGEVLALANAVRGSDGEIRRSFHNMAITSQFEPGSVMKTMVIAGLLEEGLTTPGDWLHVPKNLRLYDHTFSDSVSREAVDYRTVDILAKSSNVGTILLAQRLGPEKIVSYLSRFGIGTRTGIGFPREAAGDVPEVDRWSGTSIGTIPIGQGMASTVLQLAAAYNTIANDGEYVAPTLVTARVSGTASASSSRRPPAARSSAPQPPTR